jgi:hypothetical protein
MGARGKLQAPCQAPAAAKFTSEINGVMADAAAAQKGSGGRLNES